MQQLTQTTDSIPKLSAEEKLVLISNYLDKVEQEFDQLQQDYAQSMVEGYSTLTVDNSQNKFISINT